MSKELEMVRAMINGANEYEKKTGDKNPPVYFSKNNLLIIEKALHRLEAIDNANTSEALEWAELLECDLQATNDLVTRTINGYDYLDILETIKQALLKAQEQEKDKLLFKNIHNTKVKTPLVSIFEGLSKDERFKFTEHIYYHWEEMKEALEDKNNELEKENELLKGQMKYLTDVVTEFQKGIKIINEKNVDISYLKYDCHFELCLYNKYMEDSKQLTQEELDLLKMIYI